MEYIPPINGDTGNPDRSYINGDILNGIEGSIPAAEAIEYPMREVLEVIEAAGLTPDNEDLTQLSQAIYYIAAQASQYVRAGSMMMWPTDTPPAGWLVRDGSEISRTVYADLFAAIGTSYGVGDGATTFNVQDDRGLFERGWDNGRGYDSGRAFGSEQDDAFEAHEHSYTYRGSSNIGGDGTQASINGTTGGTTGTTGDTETRPKNRAYLPIIKY